jgi:dipeptidyl aminopeptidase/acylaminoacyl peptidase
LINAVPYIKQVDPKRIGMWGHSMGGGVTMRVLTIDSRVKGAVLYSPVSADFADIIERWGPGCFGDIAQGELIVGCNSSDVIPGDLPLNLQDAYRFAASDADMLKEISPFYHLDYVTAPVQIHYGTEDGKFLSGTPPQWSIKLTQGLRDAGKQTEMYQYEGEGHSFIGQPWFDFMTRTLRFFDKYVKKLCVASVPAKQPELNDLKCVSRDCSSENALLAHIKEFINEQRPSALNHVN